MTVLDFGPSAYARRSPYIFGDDLENSGKVIIPEGDLPLLRLKYEVLGLELKFRPDLELLNQGLEPNSIILVPKSIISCTKWFFLTVFQSGRNSFSRTVIISSKFSFALSERIISGS